MMRRILALVLAACLGVSPSAAQTVSGTASGEFTSSLGADFTFGGVFVTTVSDFDIPPFALYHKSGTVVNLYIGMVWMLKNSGGTLSGAMAPIDISSFYITPPNEIVVGTGIKSRYPCAVSVRNAASGSSAFVWSATIYPAGGGETYIEISHPVAGVATPLNATDITDTTAIYLSCSYEAAF